MKLLSLRKKNVARNVIGWLALCVALCLPGAARAEIDVDGDGQPDVLWHNPATGDVLYWTLHDGAPSGSGFLARGVPTEWTLADTADMDGDGKADLLWRNVQTGALLCWTLNGTQVRGPLPFPAAPGREWQLAGTGDMDGDGKTDLIWQHETTGDVTCWLMDGVQFRAARDVAQGFGNGWRVVGVADLNADGKPDLVFHNQQRGDVTCWLMNGTTPTQSVGIATVDAVQWRLAGVADTDNDGDCDLLWQNRANGSVLTWRMHGTALASSAWLAAGAVPAWNLAGCRSAAVPLIPKKYTTYDITYTGDTYESYVDTFNAPHWTKLQHFDAATAVLVIAPTRPVTRLNFHSDTNARELGMFSVPFNGGIAQVQFATNTSLYVDQGIGGLVSAFPNADTSGVGIFGKDVLSVSPDANFWSNINGATWATQINRFSWTNAIVANNPLHIEETGFGLRFSEGGRRVTGTYSLYGGLFHDDPLLDPPHKIEGTLTGIRRP